MTIICVLPLSVGCGAQCVEQKQMLERERHAISGQMEMLREVTQRPGWHDDKSVEDSSRLEDQSDCFVFLGLLVVGVRFLAEGVGGLMS